MRRRKHNPTPEFDDLFGFQFVELDAVDDRPDDWRGGTFGTFGKAGDVDAPGGSLCREEAAKDEGLAMFLVVIDAKTEVILLQATLAKPVCKLTSEACLAIIKSFKREP